MRASRCADLPGQRADASPGHHLRVVGRLPRHGGGTTWGQRIITRLKDGKEGGLPRLFEAPRVSEQPGSGLVRSIGARDQKDPRRVYTFGFFESEEKARAREEDPRRQEALVDVRALMGELFDGPPEFVDLEVVNDDTP